MGERETMAKIHDPFAARGNLTSKVGECLIYRLAALASGGVGDVDKLPFSVKVLLESALRNLDEFEVTSDDVQRLCRWDQKFPTRVKCPLKVARVILQD